MRIRRKCLSASTRTGTSLQASEASTEQASRRAPAGKRRARGYTRRKPTPREKTSEAREQNCLLGGSKQEEQKIHKQNRVSCRMEEARPDTGSAPNRILCVPNPKIVARHVGRGGKPMATRDISWQTTERTMARVSGCCRGLRLATRSDISPSKDSGDYF